MAHSRVLSDRYELGEELGSGGMATVYRGTDRVLGRPVAVKVLASHYARDPEFVERFRREAQSAARLNHPGVVAVYDTGDDGQDHYIVMELVEGRTLADLLEERGALPPDQAVAIAEQVAVALGAAHAEGIVHRDVKPGNVMLLPTGEAKVMDFGIARAATANTVTGTSTVLGTAKYLSPEQAEGRPVDARSDVYGLGVLLYEALAGKAPFEGDTAVSVAYKHVNETPVPPSRHNPAVPAALDAVALKALAKDPGERYQTADAMRDDLARARAGEDVEAAAGEATAPMGAVGTGTQVMAPADATSVYEPVVHEGPPDSPQESRRLWPVFAILGVVVIGAIVAIAAIAGGGGSPAAPTSPHKTGHPTATVPPSTPAQPTATEPPVTPTPTQTPSPQPSPSPTTPPPAPSPSTPPTTPPATPSATALATPTPAP